MSPYWTPARHQDRRPRLLARATIAKAVRAWFDAEGFIEVEPAMRVPSPGAETHIDAYAVDGGYLHTSPEFAMKRLLAAGETKIVSFGKVWRKGETGPLHAPEFTMLEWYRAQAPLSAIQADCVALVRAACRAIEAPALRWLDKSCDPFASPRAISVQDAFSNIARFSGDVRDGTRDYFTANGVVARADDGWSDLFSRAVVLHIEPHLGADTLTFLTDYPAQEAALARKNPTDPRTALRFEMYACGVELANGFDELTDADEQRARLIASMAEKHRLYNQSWPIDEDFLAALGHMPPASGVALGFDRLVMLATGAGHISDVLWTPHA